MAARDRLPPWHERHRLSNGRDVLVRPVRPEDAEPLGAGFTLLEPAALRSRLAASSDVLGSGEAQRLTRLNPRTDFMLVACDDDPPGEALIAALAHVHTDIAGHRGEFVVLVSPFVADMGMGRYLFTRIAKWARTRRVQRLHGDLPVDDPAMVELAESLGFQRVDGVAPPGFVQMVLERAAA